MKRRDIEKVLHDAGAQGAPPPRREFVHEVETRFGTTRVVAALAPRQRARWVIAGAATAAAVVAGAFLLAGPGDHDQNVATLPTLTTTTSTAPQTTTTAVTVGATTTSTTVVAGTTTTLVARPTTTTTVPETTTSTAPPSQDLGLQCTTRADTFAVICEWSASTHPAFDHYRVWKHTGDGPDQELYTGTATRYEDHELSGARRYYEVTALAADGSILGHGVTFVTCC